MLVRKRTNTEMNPTHAFTSKNKKFSFTTVPRHICAVILESATSGGAVLPLIDAARRESKAGARVDSVTLTD